ncbi:hypothetical protein [Streptomyces reniochalinae]|uniref:Uncharacterized protein n=1 Tax=Streptomyces reniochalinae TaxID=2250578 RepID=A0A367EIX7_9ACTN|nr:hypothetical protein [Streptomyces reniochalinae]RCG17652.1 hypothetical protein DQ392_17580 [Streptomyces reniochalinae]
MAVDARSLQAIPEEIAHLYVTAFTRRGSPPTPCRHDRLCTAMFQRDVRAWRWSCPHSKPSCAGAAPSTYAGCERTPDVDTRPRGSCSTWECGTGLFDERTIRGIAHDYRRSLRTVVERSGSG